MRQRLKSFMQGRNGNDQLNIFLLIISMAFLLLGGIFRGIVGSVFSIIVVVCLVLMYYRMLSKNIYRRSYENGKFIRFRYKTFAFLHFHHERWVQRKDYKFFSCPKCKAVLRVPRGKGKINIVCRQCGNSFSGKS